MKVFDLSIPIGEDMIVYPGDPLPVLKKVSTIEDGGYDVTEMTLGTHTGTHVDPPAHIVRGGVTVDQIPLEQLIGACQVMNLTHVKEKITADDLDSIGTSERIILLKTSNSFRLLSGVFDEDFVYLDESAAEWLVSMNVKTVGIDYFSVEEFGSKTAPVHRILFRGGIAVVEGLSLREIEAGDYVFVCLPLLIKDSDGAPARAIIIED